jgi:hypothetical protein
VGWGGVGWGGVGWADGCFRAAGGFSRCAAAGGAPQACAGARFKGSLQGAPRPRHLGQLAAEARALNPPPTPPGPYPPNPLTPLAPWAACCRGACPGRRPAGGSRPCPRGVGGEGVRQRGSRLGRRGFAVRDAPTAPHASGRVRRAKRQPLARRCTRRTSAMSLSPAARHSARCAGPGPPSSSITPSTGRAPAPAAPCAASDAVSALRMKAKSRL